MTKRRSVGWRRASTRLQILEGSCIGQLKMTTRSSSYLHACVLGILGSTIAAGGCATSSPGAEKDVKPADLEALKEVGGKAKGLVVWTSSRAGRPHLFTMRTDGSDTKQLTRGPATDWHPRFSPDGTKILFARSREKDFVRESQANDEDTWDLYTISVDGDALEKVVADATWGSWIGPDEILFLRGSKIMRTKLGSGAETKIMDTARYPLLAGAIVQQPELSPDGHTLALTLAGARIQTGLWHIKKKTWTPLGMGSQVAWAPGGASVYWVDADGNAWSRLVREAIANGEPAEQAAPSTLVDLKGKRSREFFPRLSNDGKWLVFGSAIHGLEHDLEDFEIYLCEVGGDPDVATRMTFHSANDRWPDIFVGEPGKVTPPDDEAGAAPGVKSGEAPQERSEDRSDDKSSEGEAARAAGASPTTREADIPPKASRAAPQRPADSQDDNDGWDEAPKKATAKAAQDDEAAPATGEDAAAPAPAASPKKKHKKKRR
jgi:hypothetical protein